MKKIHILLSLYLFIGIVLFSLVSLMSPADINGRLKSLNFARITIPYYDSGQIVHTEKTDEYIVDFVLDKRSNLYVVAIKCEKALLTTKYREEEIIGFNTIVKVEECVEFYNNTGEFQWDTASNYRNKSYDSILWCVMDSNNTITNQDISISKFTIDSKEYTLYVNSSK